MGHPLLQLVRRLVSAVTAPIGEGSTRNAAAAVHRLEESQSQETEVLAGLVSPRSALPAGCRAIA